MGDSRSWQPPPRPPELKDVHVVDGRSDSNDQIDYFALIREKPRPPSAGAIQTKQGNTNATGISKNPHKGGAQPAIPAKPEVIEFGIETKIFTHPTVRFITKQKRKLAIAAALSFVSYASWSILHSISPHGSREPAAVSSKENVATPPPAPKPASAETNHGGKLGQGNAKRMGEPANNNFPASNASTSVQHTTEENRQATETPQFYSSSEAPSPPPETPAEAMSEAMTNYNTNPSTFPQDGYDQNNGAVNPPTLTPPQPPPAGDASF